MKNKVLRWINSKIKDTDRFSIPICLNYKGKNSYRTTFGGVWSIVIALNLLIYSIILFIQMTNREGSIINTVTKRNNLIYDSTKYNLKDYNFVIGVYSLNRDYSKLLDTSYIILKYLCSFSILKWWFILKLFVFWFWNVSSKNDFSNYRSFLKSY